ncbi:B12-binding domain-containing radical SAM protein [Methanobacterium sp. SMA-27]|uniref:B12-binding domain-containing radical SAM protein n=1 Tax=Methanobacterium sp. SMA-27 TaxID=1495336 RepID=UPI00064F6896|nr:radical SAM protein [Methanobacterium sp. SMA-27]
MESNKKVLFFNAKREKCDSDSPHLGLATLAAVLKKSGYEVLVVDYQFKPNAPSPEIFLDDFKPDVMGITLYTATMNEADKIIKQISKFDIPILVGGPHATLYYNDLVNKANYILIGEAENIIEETVKKANIHSKGLIIRSEPPDPKNLPFPDFTSFFGYGDIFVYPLLTSRGCPYNCSFCAVRFVSTRKWRPRWIEDCIEEVIQAKKVLKSMDSVVIYDDNAMFRKDHIKKFLNLYLDKNINLPLTIINTRADGLDNEIISLLKKAKCPSIGIGVESGHPEVFELINKGETLEDIVKASKLIKKHKLSLQLCFVIGLEGDSYEKIQSSIDFAKKINPDHIYWNMITPFEGTKIREWYDKNGSVFDLVNHSSYVDGDFMCEEPCAETPEFSVEERKKAYILAILKTNYTTLKFRDTPRLFFYIKEYGFYKEFICWIPNKLWVNIKKPFLLLRLAINIYPEVGMKGLIKRIKQY